MTTFTVTIAYYDAWNEQTLVVDADSVDEACAKAIEIADGERVDHFQSRAWDPGVSFVAGIAEGGDLDDNEGPYVLDNVIGGAIPFDHSEETAFGAAVLRDALRAALPELKSELEQREHSGNVEAIEPLRAIAAQGPQRPEAGPVGQRDHRSGERRRGDREGQGRREGRDEVPRLSRGDRHRRAAARRDRLYRQACPQSPRSGRGRRRFR